MRRPSRPIIILYGHQFSGNLKALYREWDQQDLPKLDLYFLSLDPAQTHNLKQEGVQALSCSALADMMRLAICSTIITDHGLHLMKPLLKLTDIRFIDVWHGVPFKGFGPTDFRLQHLYDEIWVPSSGVRDIYVQKLGFDAAKVAPLGYARTDTLMQKTRPDPGFRHYKGIPEDKKVILYAPTWQQDLKDRSLIPFALDSDTFLTRISEVCEKHSAVFVIRAHQNCDIPQTPQEHIHFCPQHDFPDTEAILREANILVSDWSSIVFDYLPLRRPTLFIDCPAPFKNGFTFGPEYRFGAITPSQDALEKSLADYLDRPDEYQRIYGRKIDLTIATVYGNANWGHIASSQLEHLQQSLSVQDN
jgi:CDP-glycerol glycerophosphotransferase (TagB/SpsB family)